MKVFFYANEEKPAAVKARAELAGAAQARGLACTDAPFAADAVVALGGDGTILRAVHEFPGIPVLGFNLGGLGYLSSVGRSEFDHALGDLAAERFTVAERTMLQVRRGRGEEAIPPKAFRALNDIVIVREMSGHAALLDLAVDGRPAARYMADGLVFATPTGSTAYSLSAGGPVLMPDSASFAVTPMNPHALGVRPMVVSDRVRLTVTSRRRVNGKAEKIGVYADGESVFLLDGDESVTIEKSPAGARLVALEGYDPYAVMSKKLGWSGSNVK